MHTCRYTYTEHKHLYVQSTHKFISPATVPFEGDQDLDFCYDCHGKSASLLSPPSPHAPPSLAPLRRRSLPDMQPTSQQVWYCCPSSAFWQSLWVWHGGSCRGSGDPGQDEEEGGTFLAQLESHVRGCELERV